LFDFLFHIAHATKPRAVNVIASGSQQNTHVRISHQIARSEWHRSRRDKLGDDAESHLK